MTKLISIHIPKTAGTSFYNILKQVYGEQVSPSLKRRDLGAGIFPFQSYPVLHGHFYYHEIEELHHKTKAPLLCWLRHPVDRVISNYCFFIEGLQHPTRNPTQYELNKHRKEESLLSYASRAENSNRMSAFLKGIELKELTFIGRQEHFQADMNRLSKQMNWPQVQIPKLNTGPRQAYPATIRQKILALNIRDWNIYQEAFFL